jgi:cytochrome c oxidase assembly protein subunit 15
MVASGLADAPRVSHLKLTLHLGLGLTIFGYAVWLLLGETFGRPTSPSAWTPIRSATLALTILVGVTVLSGGLMAGLKAGYAFPTFPLMAGALVPDGLFAADPAWKNFVDNVVMVQFQHRALAMSVLVGVLLAFFVTRRMELGRYPSIGFSMMLGLALMQVGLGIATLLFHVPVALAAAHQANAALLIAASLYTNFSLLRFPAPAKALVRAKAPSAGDALVEPG